MFLMISVLCGCTRHTLNGGLVAIWMIGAIIACLGVYPTIAVNLAWAGGNAGGDAKRGVVIAMVIGIGNLGGWVFSRYFAGGCIGKLNWWLRRLCYLTSESARPSSTTTRHDSTTDMGL